MRIWPQGRSGSIELSEQVADSIASVTAPSMNREAFRIFYNRTNRGLWGYLLRVSGRRDVADDLLQESYCRFLAAKVPEMDAAESKSYLFRIATNLLHDRWRRREFPGVVSTSCESCEYDLETRTDVHRALERLKPRERQLLWLAHVEGFDHREIARMMGLKAGSVRVLLFRARSEFTAALNKRPQVGGG